MSSYLSFFIVPKRKSQEEPKRHIILSAYCRSTELYQYFSKTINPVFAGHDKETVYTTLTTENVEEVLQDFDKDINSARRRLVEFEKYAKDNIECIKEIIGLQDHISNLEYWKNKASFIADMIDVIDCYDEIEEICCNID